MFRPNPPFNPALITREELEAKVRRAAYAHVMYCTRLNWPDPGDQSEAAMFQHHLCALKMCRSLARVIRAQRQLADFLNAQKVRLWDEV